MSVTRVYLALAVPFAIAYALLTPPWQVPDEVGHYYRARAVGEGDLSGGLTATLPRDARDLVAVTWMDLSGRLDARYDFERIKFAAAFPPNAAESVELRPLATYTAVPYVAHGVTLAAARVLRVRPLFAFYAARAVNAVAAVLLVALAIRMTPVFSGVFAAVGLTPMFLFLGGSFSADALTTALAFCTIACALRVARETEVTWRHIAAVAVFALLTTLAKPGYILLPLLALAIRDRRARAAAVLATILGAAVSISTAAGGAPLPAEGHVDAREQFAGVVRDPLRFAGVMLRDYAKDGRGYLEQLVGGLGWLDVPIPQPLLYGYLLVLLYVAWSAEEWVTRGERWLSVAIAAGTLAAISGSLYLAWSVVGAADIEGIQGRYFLPVAPVVLLAISAPKLRKARWLVPCAGALMNVAALVFLVRRYW